MPSCSPSSLLLSLPCVPHVLYPASARCIHSTCFSTCALPGVLLPLRHERLVHGALPAPTAPPRALLGLPLHHGKPKQMSCASSAPCCLTCRLPCLLLPPLRHQRRVHGAQAGLVAQQRRQLAAHVLGVVHAAAEPGGGAVLRGRVCGAMCWRAGGKGARASVRMARQQLGRVGRLVRVSRRAVL